MAERPGSQPLFGLVCNSLEGPAAPALTKQKVAGTMKLLRNTALVPEWRNWQTRQVQDLVLAREWRFESSFGHHYLCSHEIHKTLLLLPLDPPGILSPRARLLRPRAIHPRFRLAHLRQRPRWLPL